MKGKLIIVSGPSGTGKSTVTKIVKDKLNIPLSISATTRKPRNGEIDGKDYYFLTKEEFLQKIKNERKIDYEKNYYCNIDVIGFDIMFKCWNWSRNWRNPRRNRNRILVKNKIGRKKLWERCFGQFCQE